MKYIICDFARSNWGKTKTLLEVIEQLKTKAYLIDEIPIAPDDKFAVFEMNGEKIVVNTQGDPNSYQEEGLKRAVNENADIIVCSSRIKGTTEKCIYTIAENGYEIIWFSNFFADNDSLPCVGIFPEITAEAIVNLIQKLIQ